MGGVPGTTVNLSTDHVAACSDGCRSECHFVLSGAHEMLAPVHSHLEEKDRWQDQDHQDDARISEKFGSDQEPYKRIALLSPLTYNPSSEFQLPVYEN
ncbi:hypothetical protein U0070_002628 [Myodes glareolus]|uniref:Uncharacterized protein n=1 Tax=Myodes glareolus TaxID=447135 RepID=A0AAW0HR50_MYOGA